jgi:hypothetical protein
MAELPNYINYIGNEEDYLLVFPIKVYINKFKEGLKSHKFKVTKEYLYRLGYKEGEYSPELLFENILKKVIEEDKLTTGGYNKNNKTKKKNKTIKNNKTKKNNKTIKNNNNTIKKTKYKSLRYEFKKEKTSKFHKPNITKSYIKKKYSSINYNKKTKKGGGDPVQVLPVTSSEANSNNLLNPTKEQLNKAYEIQNMYRFICYINALNYLLVGVRYNEMYLIDQEETIDEQIRTNEEMLNFALDEYFIKPKINLKNYLTANEDEINSTANIYVLNTHGALGRKYFQVPEKTIIIINTNLNKTIICLDQYMVKKKLLELFNAIEQESNPTTMYSIYMNLYSLFSKELNPHAFIYLPDQYVNDMSLQIDRKDFEPLFSVKDNEENKDKFREYTDDKGNNHTLSSIITGYNSFELFSSNNFKVIYIAACNISYKRNINADYIYNYFMRLTSPYLNKYTLSTNHSFVQQINNASNLEFSKTETNTLLSQPKNLYDNLVKKIIINRDLETVIEAYELILREISEAEVDFLYILLLIIFYFTNEDITTYNLKSINFIIRKLYENRKVSDYEDKEYTKELLELELKKLFELYIDEMDYKYKSIISISIFKLYKDLITIDIVKKLLLKFKDKKDELLIINIKGFTPLHIYLDNNGNNPEIVKLLIDEEQTVLTITDFYDRTPLHIYLHNNDNNPEIVSLLIDKDQTVLTIEVTGLTPLYKYLNNNDNNPEIVSLLIDKDKTVLTIEVTGLTPLDKYLNNNDNNPEIIKLLIDEDQTVLKTSKGFTPLNKYLYDYGNNPEIVKLLIDKDQTVLPITDFYGSTPLDKYLNNNDNNPEIIKLLIDEDKTVLKKSKGLLPLHKYIVKNGNNPEIVKLLIDKDQTVLTTDFHGSTPLDIYLKNNNNPEIVKLLTPNV